MNKSLVGKSTDPKRFSDTDLMEREASYGRSGFQLQFMLDTSLSDANRYPLKLSDLSVMDIPLEDGPSKVIWASGPDQIIGNDPDLFCVGFGGDRFYRPMEIQTPYQPYQGSVLYIDPAGRGKDETGYSVVKQLNGLLYCTAWGGFLGGYDERNLAFLARLAEIQKVKLVLVEPNFGDGMFAQLLRPVMAKIHPQCSIEDSEWAKGQKELRIIDTLEPVMNQHRLIMDRKVLIQDYRSTQSYATESALKYQGCYQMTRLTRDRGSLAHDDRLEALAGAVGHWTAHMAKDVDKSKDQYRAKMLDEELRGFMNHAFSVGRKGSRGSFSKGKTWLNLH